MFIVKILIYGTLWAQSYADKPVVPVFQYQGERQVRVDCWPLFEDRELIKIWLGATSDPKIFTAELSLLERKYLIQVNLHESENTLIVSDLELEKDYFTYATEMGWEDKDQRLYCSIFLGEIESN